MVGGRGRGRKIAFQYDSRYWPINPSSSFLIPPQKSKKKVGNPLLPPFLPSSLPFKKGISLLLLCPPPPATFCSLSLSLSPASSISRRDVGHFATFPLSQIVPSTFGFISRPDHRRWHAKWKLSWNTYGLHTRFCSRTQMKKNRR